MSDDEDTWVQYYIVRTDLPMTIGKIGAQIAHAAQMFAFKYTDIKANLAAMVPILRDADPNEPIPEHIPKQLGYITSTTKWMENGITKVILGGKASDFEKIKSELDVLVVVDAGKNEIEPGTETVIVTWPMQKSDRPKVLSKLQTLKSAGAELPLPEAARELWDDLKRKGAPDIVSVGVRAQSGDILVYIHSNTKTDHLTAGAYVPSRWRGYPVKIAHSGPISLASVDVDAMAQLNWVGDPPSVHVLSHGLGCFVGDTWDREAVSAHFAKYKPKLSGLIATSLGYGIVAGQYFFATKEVRHD